MKTKIFALLLAAVLLLSACVSGGGEESTVPNNSVPPVENSTPGVENSTPVENNSTPAENSTPVEENSTPAENSSPAEENSKPSEETSKPAEESKPDNGGSSDGIYSGQSMDTHGMDRKKLEEFLEDSLFVGDSVTDGFKLYVNNYGNMPYVNFFSAASYGYINACKDKATSSIHPKIGGERKYIWEAVEYYEAERVFINFGLNDFGYITDTKLVECMDTICNNIKEVSPETEIVFLSCGFFTKSARDQGKGVDNDRVRNKNEVVLNYCKENGYDFIDVSWVYADSNGYLKSEYSYDNYCHMKYDKYDFWEEILMAYAADKLLNQYENIDTMLK